MIESEKESKKPGPGRPGSGASIRKTSSSSSPAVRASSMDRPSSAGGVRNQVWTLEKKNKQLNNATKQLEEKVKNLAQKSTAVKKTNDNSPAVRTVPRVAAPKDGPSSTRASSAPPRELPQRPAGLEKRRGSTVTSRIREREAEFQKQVKDREDQISRLKERLKILSQKLASNKDGRGVGGREVYDATMTDGVELQSIIKQVTKERMQLERHLQIANDSLQRNNGVDLSRYLVLEQTNCHLRQQLDSLDLLQQEHKLVEIQYREKEEACRELMSTLKYKSALCEDLESQLAKVIEKNTELTIANSDLQKKVLELKDVNEECESLKTSLARVEIECVTAKSEVTNLSGKVRNLESVLDEMHKAADTRREIERQHKEALESLKRKQDEVEFTATKKQEDFINTLKARIEGLENEKRLQNEKHQELVLELAEMKKYGTGGPESLASDIEQPSDNLEIDEIMAKLEQDNKFLAELEKQRQRSSNETAAAAKTGKQLSPSVESGGSGGSPTSSTTLHRAHSAITDSGFLSQSSLAGGAGGHSPTSSSKSNGALHKLPGLTGLADKINLLNGHSYADSKAAETSQSVNISKDGMIEMPGKGWRFVFVARYSYDPFQHSPNDSPEAELQVNAGDYILVWADADEDGFFDGELLDGRRGLVPSNFVEKLVHDDLVDFHQQVVLGLGDCDDSVCTSVPQDLDILSVCGDEDKVVPPKPAKRLSKSSNSLMNDSDTDYPVHKQTLLPQYASCTDLEMTEDEADSPSSTSRKVPPAPWQLTMEAQHNKAVVIGWTAPEQAERLAIESYELIIDGSAHSTVPHRRDGSTLKATVNGLDLSVIHRVSVKAVLTDGRKSHEQACTMVVGKNAPLGPTMLRATRTTSTSATVAWIPSNTNFLHSISVNNHEIKTVRPGVFKHTLAGLSPNTVYRVTVRAKNIKAAPYVAVTGAAYDQLSSHLEVRTAPKGLPEAPVDVQVEVGPRAGTLLVSWLPVTITPMGTSNGAPVTGYVVYGNGQSLMDVSSGTADQAVVELGTRLDVKYITVRTKSNDVLSNQSDVVAVPKDFFGKTSGLHNLTVDDSTDSEDSEGEVIHNIRQMKPQIKPQQQQQPQPVISQPREVLISYNHSGYPELDSDIGPSELSDIAEEPEEGLTTSEEESGKSTPVTTSKSPSRSPEVMEPEHVPPPKASSSPVNKVSSFSLKPGTSSWKPDDDEEEEEDAIKDEMPKWSQISSSQFQAQPLLFTPPKVSPQSSQKQPSKAATAPVKTTTTVQITKEETKVEPSVTAAAAAAVAAAPAPNMMSKKIRLFVALFDYDPPTMSPNPEACDEELPFREGQLIKVYGEKDADGFYWGEAGNRNGYVPCNMVSEVQVEDDRVAEELFKEQSAASSAAAAAAVGTSGLPPGGSTKSNKFLDVSDDERWGDIYEDMPARRKLALYDYDPAELSPNVDAEVELSFRTGDLLLVYGDMDDDGFYMGELNGRRGLVPSNFLTDVPPGYATPSAAASSSSTSFLATPKVSANGVTNGGGAVSKTTTQQPRVLGQQRRW